MKDWSPNCKVSKLIKTEGNRQIHYTISEVPFPLQDRDAYVQFEYVQVENGTQINITALPDYKPADEDMVRIPHLNGFWLLEAISSSQTKITYQLQADPGGSIPSWIANAGAVDTPLNSIKSLRKYLK